MFAKQYHQLKITKSNNSILLKRMHLIMIGLCLLATLILFSNPSTVSKIIISVIILAYTVTIFFNPRAIRSLFQLKTQTNEDNYSEVQKWNSTSTPNQSMSVTESFLPNNTNFIRQNSVQLDGQGSFSKDYSRSQDIKNMSMSIYRSLSASGLNQSRLSRMRSTQRRRQQPKGFDLQDCNAFKDKEELNKSSAKTTSGIELIDPNNHWQTISKTLQEESQNQYLRVLENDVKRDTKWMFKRYESIKDYIKVILKSHLNEHNFTKEKIKMLCSDTFELSIDDSKSETYDLNPRGNHLHQRIQYNLFLYRIMLLKMNKITYRESQIPLKAGQRWSHIQPRLEAQLNSIQRLAEQLGIDIDLLKSNFNSRTKKFIEQYFRCIDMIEQYLENQHLLSTQNQENVSLSLLNKIAKCRTYIIYLVVRQINNNSQLKGKVEFQDYLGLQYPYQEQILLSILKKAGTEDPLAHFDVYKNKEKIACEPGDNNFLSVIYFVLKNVSKQADNFSWSSGLRPLINEIV